MSWYSDPQLFIFGVTKSSFTVYRITKEFDSSPIVPGDCSDEGDLSFSKHLALANNKESDFDAFKVTFEPKSGIYKFVNSQGLKIIWDSGNQIGTWSREELSSPFWSLPGITKQESVTEQLLADKQALTEENSELKAKISSLQNEVDNNKVEKEAILAENSILKVEKKAIDKKVLDLEAENAVLKAEVNRERDEKNVLINALKREEILTSLEVLEKQVSKLVQCCGAAGGASAIEEPWTTGRTVPRNWVPFEDLDAHEFSKNIPLAISKATGGLKFTDDNTTNIQANRFYQGIYPIVVVNVAELTPNRREARFDPEVWSLYTNAGISYAARKPFPSEMSVDAHKTC